MGRSLTAQEARLHPFKDEVFEIFDQLSAEDPHIQGFFQRIRCGDADCPLQVRFGLPDDVFSLSEADRGHRARIYDDFVVLDGVRFFIRINLVMPLEDRDPWCLTTWAEVAKEDYDRLVDAQRDESLYNDFLCTGRIVNDMSGYRLPGYFGAEVRIHAPDPQKLPVADQSTHPELCARLTEPWEKESFQEFAVLNGFL